MAGKRYTAVELSDMSMKQMEKHIAEETLGIVVNKSKTKRKVATEILTAYAERDAENQMAKVNRSEGYERPVNPALEGDGDSGQPHSTEMPPADHEQSKPDNRGGAREGAGRPKGMTADRARMARLSDCPHPVVEAGLRMLFDAWASAAKCPEVALTEHEATDLALPWTRVLEYAGIAQKIPPWMELAIVCTWNTVNTFKLKLAIVRQHKAKLDKSVESAEVKGATNATS